MKENVPEARIDNTDAILEWAGYPEESVEWEGAAEFLVEAALLERNGHSTNDDGLDEMQEAYVEAAIELEAEYQEWDGDEVDIEVQAINLFDQLANAATVHYFYDDIMAIMEENLPDATPVTRRSIYDR